MKIKMKAFIWTCGCLVVFLLSQNCYSQEKKKIISAKISKDDVVGLNARAEAVAEKDPKGALDYLQKALALSLKNEDVKGEALTYTTLGKINYNQKLFSQSVDYYLKALVIYVELNDQSKIVENRLNLGNSYEGNNNFDKALEQYNLILSEAEKSKNQEQIIVAKNRIAGVYEKQKKLDLALKYYEDVQKIEERGDNSKGKISANNNVADIYLEKKQTKKAKEYYEKSKAIASQSQNSEEVAKSYDNLSNTLRKEKKYEDEVEMRLNSSKINMSLNNKEGLADNYYKIGEVYLEQKEADKAVPFLEKSARMFDSVQDNEMKADVYQALSEGYAMQGNYSKALDNYKVYVAAKDSILSGREKSLAAAINFSDEVSLKQKKIDLLEKDMKILQEESFFNHFLIYTLSFGLLIVFGSSWMIYNSSKKRRIANQVLALKSLRSQMNPHFIFNALNSVNNYISKNDERSANKYLSDFSKLMRTVMENSQHEFISLTTELNILQLYLSLEHSRFKEKFDYELKVDENIMADQLEIPPMLIQPYIENAIWHGLRYKEDKGFLKVEIIRENGLIKVFVEDNGIGRKKSMEIKTINQKDKTSTGLKNTASRLDIINDLYRTKMKVEIEDLNKETHSGTRVILSITPLKLQA